MNNFGQLSALIILAAAAGTSQAVTVDHFDDHAAILVVAGSSLRRTIHYNPNLWNPGDVNFATLTLFLGDDSNHDPFEYARITQVSDGSVSLGPSEIVEVDRRRFAPIGYFDFDVSAILNADDAAGNLAFTLYSPYNKHGLGDFFYKGAQLHVDFNPVPLPASIAFLAPAILLLGRACRHNDKY